MDSCKGSATSHDAEANSGHFVFAMNVPSPSPFTRKIFFIFGAVVFLSGILFSQSLPGIPGKVAVDAPAAAAEPGATPAESFITIEGAKKLRETVEADGEDVFLARNGATPEELEEYLRLIAQLVNVGDLESVRSIATPEFQAETARIEAMIQDFHQPDITPENGLAIYDQARTSARMAETWSEIITDFSKSEAEREERAFNELKSKRQTLDEMRGTPAETPRQLWLVQLQELRVSTALANYQAAQNSSLRDADSRMEVLKGKLNEMIVQGLRDRVVFPEALLNEKLAAITAQYDPVVEQGRTIAENLANATTRLASTKPDTPDEYWLNARVISIQRQLEASNFERLLLEIHTELWRQRFALWSSADARDFIKARDAIRGAIRDIQTWQPLVSSRLQEVRRLQTDAVDATPEFAGEPPKSVLAEFAAEQKIIDALASAFGDVQNLADLSNLDIDEREKSLNITGQVERTAVQFSDMFFTAWNFTLFELNDSYKVNDQVVERTSGVTVGMLVLALLILSIGAFFSSRFCKWLSARMKSRFRLEDNTAVMVEKFSHYTMMVIFLLVALGIVKIPLTIFALLGGATAIAIGFGAQQLFNNLISGVILLFERPIRIGDRIEVDIHSGTVTAIGTRCSRLRRPDGVEILIPNSLLLQNALTNWTLSDKLCRQEILVGVAYGSPIEKAAEIVRAELDAHPNVLQNPEPMVLFNDFGTNALSLRVLYWIDSAVSNSILFTPSDLRFTIYRKLEAAGIQMPFPQRDVHLATSQPISVEIRNAPNP
jgi:small-conductance mechanosensitive channel